MSETKKTCFVVMGFGKKTDYQTGRVLDLDKSYRYIIKKAAEDAGLDCKRADEIVHSGLIDVPMYEQLLTADVVIADISTSNANAFYELGVRHALRPYTTITIAEDKMTFPFDVSHLAVRKYQHMGDGIDFEEVMRMRAALTEAIRTILKKPEKDSPVYAFFSDLDPPARRKVEQSIAQSSPEAVTSAEVDAHNDLPGKSASTMSVLVEQANAAIANSDFGTAATLLNLARNMAPKDPYLLQRLALATYKSKKPDTGGALQRAAAILAELAPESSNDPETLGLWGSIHKRLWEVTKKAEMLDTAVAAYEKGFNLRGDPYSGINLAFLFDLRCSLSAGDEGVCDRVLAQRTRKRVLAKCEAALPDSTRLGAADRYWILATMAQAYAGLRDDEKAEQYLEEARALGQPQWMVDSTEEQISHLRALLRQTAGAGA